MRTKARRKRTLPVPRVGPDGGVVARSGVGVSPRPVTDAAATDRATSRVADPVRVHATTAPLVTPAGAVTGTRPEPDALTRRPGPTAPRTPVRRPPAFGGLQPRIRPISLSGSSPSVTVVARLARRVADWRERLQAGPCSTGVPPVPFPSRS